LLCQFVRLQTRPEFELRTGSGAGKTISRDHRTVCLDSESPVRLDELQFDLPGELIAQRPAEPRDASRLLVLDRATGRAEHRFFRDVGEYLRPGDGLVLNDTRVIPARFYCRRATGGRVEALFQHEADGLWRVLLKPAARLKVGERLICPGHDGVLVLCERLARGDWLVRPEPSVGPLELLQRVGQTPLPPYIQRDPQPDADDVVRYQTVYARRAGAIAAPTAGLHFTPELLARLRSAGVRLVQVTLHVGVGTFTPISVEDVTRHQMHAEYYEVAAPAIEALHATRVAGGRIVAVGTTSVRVLESLESTLGSAAAPRGASSGWTSLFVYPPHHFRNVDRLLTNFHQPGSTLLALVMAFAGIEPIRKAYQEAIDRRYRFYSYGDAMLIL
jgi:S-adenosylmethionine:tRNA ribosyltransferase-isomerase